MKFKEFLKEDKAKVKELADAYLKNLLATAPSMLKMVNAMLKDRQLSHEDLVKAAHVGYNYLLQQKSIDNWNQKIKIAGDLVMKNLK